MSSCILYIGSQQKYLSNVVITHLSQLNIMRNNWKNDIHKLQNTDLTKGLSPTNLHQLIGIEEYVPKISMYPLP